MARHRHLFTALSLGLGLLTVAPIALADATLSADGQKTRSSLDFRIIIPPLLRLVENSFPTLLPTADAQTGRISAEQRVVLVSTLRKGFCMDLRLTQPGMTGWQVRATANAGVWVQPSEGGYRVCANRAGRYDVALQHEFTLADNRGVGTAPVSTLRPSVAAPVSASVASTTALGWPVYLDLAAL